MPAAGQVAGARSSLSAGIHAVHMLRASCAFAHGCAVTCRVRVFETNGIYILKPWEPGPLTEQGGGLWEILRRQVRPRPTPAVRSASGRSLGSMRLPTWPPWPSAQPSPRATRLSPWGQGCVQHQATQAALTKPWAASTGGHGLLTVARRRPLPAVSSHDTGRHPWPLPLLLRDQSHPGL